MKILLTVITCIVAVCVVGCRRSKNIGKIDDWTWDAPDLKVRTCTDRTKRVRADVKNGQIELKFGEVGGDNPLDIWIEHTEIVPAPKNGKWSIWWAGYTEFTIEHSDLGIKTWAVWGVSPMVVRVKTEWHHNSNG